MRWPDELAKWVKLGESGSMSGFLGKNAIYPTIPFIRSYYVRESDVIKVV